MKRTFAILLIGASLLAWSALPAQALTPARSWFVKGTIQVHISTLVADSISGKIRSTKTKCLVDRTIGADYKDFDGSWRVFGYTNSTLPDGSFTVNGFGPHGRPAALWLYSRRVGNTRCSNGFLRIGI